MFRTILARLGIVAFILIGTIMAIGSGNGGRTNSDDTANLPAAETPVNANIYYVRPDGGSLAQCSGMEDKPYSGSQDLGACAWNHPFQAMPPGGDPRIAGGDTLIIAAGSYMMGFGAPGSERCSSDFPWRCHMPPIPSGIDVEQPTRILGAGWDVGCPSPPELWGTERADMVIDLTGSNYVELGCLEVTDHSSCVDFHSGGLSCQREAYPFGPWSAIGVYAQDANHIKLSRLNIHGMAHTGIQAGRLSNWQVADTRIAANGWSGWDGDIAGSDSNSGIMIFRNWTVAWNGCGETYPDQAPIGCWGQTAGGYGDGVGTGDTGGIWLIEDSRFLHNTSDGLDLLYHSLGGEIILNRVRAEGNAGNQIKVTGPTTITNSLIVGNCAFFEDKSFTHDVDHCRALGNALEVVFTGGEAVVIGNSTLYGHGDGLVGGGVRDGFECTGNEAIVARNTIFMGDSDYHSDGTDLGFVFYQEDCRGLRLDSDHNIAFNVKNFSCGQSNDLVQSGPSDICADPLLNGPIHGESYGMRPTRLSPAIDAGTDQDAPANDLDQRPRPLGAGYDIGAYEYSGDTS